MSDRRINTDPTQKPKVIAFAGLAQTGKTTAANFVHAETENSRIISFASPIKHGLATMGVYKEEEPELYRHLAQYIGTDCIRAKYPNWWATLMVKNIMKAHDGGQNVFIIDDIRFPNEVECLTGLRSMGFDVITCMVYSKDRMQEAYDTNPLYQHDSEKLAREWREDFFVHAPEDKWGLMRLWCGNAFDWAVQNDDDLSTLQKYLSWMLNSANSVVTRIH
jgi:hypothetical protein